MEGLNRSRKGEIVKIPELFPKLPKKQKVQQLWKDLEDIYKTLWLPKNWIRLKSKILPKKTKKMDRTFYIYTTVAMSLPSYTC